MSATNMDACPFCGHDTFYRKTRMTGTCDYMYQFDGSDAYNGHIHDGLTYKESKTAYCAKCHKPLRNLKEK